MTLNFSTRSKIISFIKEGRKNSSLISSEQLSKKLRIRPWQNECLAKAMHCLRSTVSREFLIDAAPGAGKTICALLIAKMLLKESLYRKNVPNTKRVSKYPVPELVRRITVIQKKSEARKKLKLIGSELISILKIENGINPSDEIEIEIKYQSGDIKKIKTLCRIDTKNELEYYKNGGILQFVLRNMM